MLDTEKMAAELDVALLEMEVYVTEHLNYEEALLREVQSDDYPAHRALHDAFRAKLKETLAQARSSAGQSMFARRGLLRRVAVYVGDWLCDHIRNVDRRHLLKEQLEAADVAHRQPRYPFTGRVLLALSGGRGITGVSVNMSDTGMFIETPPPPPDWLREGERGLIHFLPRDAAEPGKACIVVRLEATRIAIRFEKEAGGKVSPLALISGQAR